MPKQPMTGKPNPPTSPPPSYEPITSNPISKAHMDGLKEMFGSNPDITEDQRARMEAVRNHTLEHAQFLVHFVPNSVELTRALEKLQEVAMWCNKAISLEK